MMLLNSFLLSSSLSSLQDIWMFKQWQTFNFFYLFWKLILPDTFKQSNISSNEMYKVLFVGSYCGHHNTKPAQKSPLHSPDKKSNYIRLRCEYISTLRRGWDVFTSFLLHIFNNFFLSHPKKKQNIFTKLSCYVFCMYQNRGIYIHVQKFTEFRKSDKKCLCTVIKTQSEPIKTSLTKWNKSLIQVWSNVSIGAKWFLEKYQNKTRLFLRQRLIA